MSCRENDLDKIKMALSENPNMNAIDLVKKTNLPSRTIISFLNDGTLTPVNIKPQKNIKGFYIPKDATPQWHINVDNIFQKK